MLAIIINNVYVWYLMMIFFMVLIVVLFIAFSKIADPAYKNGEFKPSNIKIKEPKK